MKKVLVNLSGGMDSATVLYECIANPEKEVIGAVNFYYGSKHNSKESVCARILTHMTSVPLYKINLDFINEHFSSHLLQSGGEIPEGHYADENMKKTVVPFRNGIILAIAAGLAESKGADEIALGNHKGDHAIYPDCRDSFTLPMAAAIRMGTYKGIELYTPFSETDKTGIVKFGYQLGVPYENTYTCYKGGDKHCGKCGSCTERKEAFQLAGVKDPTEYEV
jgi:7-cyano-7-deazaguanine synthase